MWEKDCDAVKFDIDDLVQIESALQEICNITAGLTAGTMASDMTRTRAAETAGRARFFGH